MATKNVPTQVDFPAVTEAWEKTVTFVKAAKTIDIPDDKMLHVEVDGNEIIIANVEGRFYAVGVRCLHMSALLSKGVLNNRIATCPRHFSSFDVITGKSVSAGQTQDLPVYEVKVEGNELFVDIE